MSKIQVTDLLNQRQIHRRYGCDLCKLGSRYTLPITPIQTPLHLSQIDTASEMPADSQCKRYQIPKHGHSACKHGSCQQACQPFQLRHTATWTYHFTKNTSSTQSSGANRHTFLDTALCILFPQTIDGMLPIHLSYFPVILPHIQIPTHGRIRVEQPGKHLLRSNSWQWNPSTFVLHRQHPLCPVKSRVGSDKPRKSKHYIESQVKHNERYPSTPLPTYYQARNLTQRMKFSPFASLTCIAAGIILHPSDLAKADNVKL